MHVGRYVRPTLVYTVACYFDVFPCATFVMYNARIAPLNVSICSAEYWILVKESLIPQLPVTYGPEKI